MTLYLILEIDEYMLIHFLFTFVLCQFYIIEVILVNLIQRFKMMLSSFDFINRHE